MILWLALSFFTGTIAEAGQTAFPVKISRNSRYFVDQNGQPVFWLDFDSMQTWNRVGLIYPMVTKDYNLKPVKPVLMAAA